MTNIIFDGYYKIFPDVDESYNSEDICAGHMAGQLGLTQQLLNTGQPQLREFERKGKSLLSFLAAISYTQNSELHIIDVGGGGGAGQELVDILLCLPNLNPDKLTYTLVELPYIAQALSMYLPQLFSTKLPINNVAVRDVTAVEFSLREGLTIFNFASSIQYVRDWKALLKSICNSAPKYLLFTNTPFNSHLTYIRRQVNLTVPIYQHVIGHEDFVSYLLSFGYENIYRAHHELNYLTKDTPEGTVTSFSTLLFRKVNEE